MDRRELLASMAVVGAGGFASTARAGIRVAGGRDAVTGNSFVRTSSGPIMGFTRNRVDTYLGIPYGAPPVGQLRFAQPRRPQPWSQPFQALAYGPQAPFVPPSFQPPGGGYAGPQDRFLLYRDWTSHVTSEDCLRLNVWAPSGPGSRPIMVYMHGGGLAAGSGNDLLAYDGHNLATRGDVVVVTHNHRLNLFGYLDLSSFGGRWRECSNLGMHDIVAVLAWVRDNAAAFGGDPDNVTIFGQSGGGAKVSALMAMPAARGLFHRAIVQSGSPAILGENTPDQARALADRVLGKLGVDSQSLDRLLSMPAEQLAAGNLEIGLGWKMTVGGTSIPVRPGSASRAAQSVPLLVGSNLNEFVNAVDNPQAAGFTEADLHASAQKRFGRDGAAIAAAYRASYPGRPPFEVYAAIETAGVREAALAQAANNFAVTGAAWEYLFAWRTPVLSGVPGTFHSAEIAFVFDNATLCVNQTGGGMAAVALGRKMSGAWIAFARHGKPDHAGLPSWPTFGQTSSTMMFDDRCRIVADPESKGRMLIRASRSAPTIVPG